MVLHFQFSPENLKQYQAAASILAQGTPDPKPNNVLFYGLTPLCMLIVGVVSEHMGIGLLAGLLFTGAHLFTREWYQSRAREKALSPEVTALAIKPWRLELKAESIPLKNEDMFQEFALRNYRGLTGTTNFLFLAFADGSHIGFPKSAFASPAEQDAFREALKIHTPLENPSVSW